MRGGGGAQIKVLIIVHDTCMEIFMEESINMSCKQKFSLKRLLVLYQTKLFTILNTENNVLTHTIVLLTFS